MRVRDSEDGGEERAEEREKEKGEGERTREREREREREGITMTGQSSEDLASSISEFRIFVQQKSFQKTYNFFIFNYCLRILGKN